MPNHHVPAAATGLPSRRSLLAAAAILAATRATAATPLTEMIERHRTAHAALNEFCAIEDSVEGDNPRRAAVEAEWSRRSDLEEAALDDLCAFRPATMEEVRARGEYLHALLRRNVLTDWQQEALLASFAG